MEWSYATLTVPPDELGALPKALDAFGADGWELTTSVSTPKEFARTEAKTVFVFKKAGPGHVAPTVEVGAIY
jgi:hypothetical protein